MAKVAGLTGGIGTGKTTVAKFFKEWGVHIIDADVIAREVVKKGLPAWEEIRREFGPSVLRDDGEIDREKLGKIVFSSQEKRERLNAIVHPYVRERMLAELEKALRESKDVILDIPLLFENRIHEWLRPVILVYAPEKVQIERIMKRDGLTVEECLKRIRAQMPIEEKKLLADYIIDNSGDINRTREDAASVYRKVFLSP